MVRDSPLGRSSFEVSGWDPGFALAWAHLCRQQALVFLNLDQSPQRREAVRHALEMATKFGPSLPETELAAGFYHYAVERDYEGAKTHYEAVRRTFPNNSLAPELLAGVARRQGHWEESRVLYAQAIELDPQNVFLLTDAALGDLARRDAAAAQQHLARARDLNPQNTTVLSFLAVSFQLSGDIARAQTFLDGLQPAQGDAILVSAIEGNAIFLRKYDSAIAMMKTQLEKPGELGTSLGSFENWFGDLQRHAGRRDAFEGRRTVLIIYIGIINGEAEGSEEAAVEQQIDRPARSRPNPRRPNRPTPVLFLTPNRPTNSPPRSPGCNCWLAQQNHQTMIETKKTVS